MRLLRSLVVLAVALAPPQTRDVPRFQAGTAVLSGTVVADEPNGQPIRRALVTVLIGSDIRQQYQTSTDDRGRFTVGGLPAGNVRLIVAKPGYVQTYYGAKQPGSTLGVPIALTSGQTVEVSARLPRGGVIAGTVTDENGQPMPGVGVRVQRVTMSATGQRTLTSYTGALVPSTDDSGAYRVYGLPAGDYVASAQPRLAAGAEVRQTSAAELQWAERQIRGGGAGAGVAGGTTDTSALAPVAGQTITYASVYFPGTVNAAMAGIVSLAAGQERAGVDLRMQFVPTARVEGTVMGLDGQPARGANVVLLPDTDGAGQDTERLVALIEVGLIGGTSATTAADGSFSLQGVAPGGYTVLARNGPMAGRSAAAAPGVPDVAWAMTDIRVDGRDIGGLAMRLAPGQTVSGRVEFEGAAPPPASLRASVTLRASTSRGLSVATQSFATGGANDVFTVSDLIPAPYRVGATVAGWTLKSAIMDGRDVADVPLEIRPGEDVSGLVLTFTQSPAEVSGTLFDGAGRPTSDLSIIVFAADRAMWFAGSRRVPPAARPANNGRFTIGGLVAGDYYVAAVTDVSAADLANPQWLEQIVPAAIRISIAEGEKKVQDVKIAR